MKACVCVLQVRQGETQRQWSLNIDFIFNIHCEETMKQNLLNIRKIKSFLICDEKLSFIHSVSVFNDSKSWAECLSVCQGFVNKDFDDSMFYFIIKYIYICYE